MQCLVLPPVPFHKPFIVNNFRSLEGSSKPISHTFSDSKTEVDKIGRDSLLLNLNPESVHLLNFARFPAKTKPIQKLTKCNSRATSTNHFEAKLIALVKQAVIPMAGL
jgi:hypothetical protein